MFDWVYKLVGNRLAKKLDLQEGTVMETKSWYKSKAVWTAIVAVIIGAVQPISQALGHPVTIPDWVTQVLGGLGIYSLRMAEKPIG